MLYTSFNSWRAVSERYNWHRAFPRKYLALAAGFHTCFAPLAYMSLEPCCLRAWRWWLSVTSNLKDFGSFLASAQEFVEGAQPVRGEQSARLLGSCRSIKSVSTPSVNLNPPISVLLFAPFAHVDPVLAFRSWRLVSLILYAVALILLSRRYRNGRRPRRWQSGHCASLASGIRSSWADLHAFTRDSCMCVVAA